MRLATLAVAVVLLLTGFAPAETPLPISPPPSILTVAEVKTAQGQLVCHQFVMIPVQIRQKKVIEEDGKKREVEEVVTTMITEPRLVTFALKGSKAQTADGKPLTADDLARRLNPGSAILIANGGAVDPIYLKLVKADTIILIPAAMNPVPVPDPVPPPPDVRPLPLIPKPLPLDPKPLPVKPDVKPLPLNPKPLPLDPKPMPLERKP